MRQLNFRVASEELGVREGTVCGAGWVFIAQQRCTFVAQSDGRELRESLLKTG